jgi:hypothetical protein
MEIGFRRHKTTKKVFTNEKPQIALGFPWLQAFSVDQSYSLTGCSSAEPTSVSLDLTNLKNVSESKRNLKK